MAYTKQTWVTGKDGGTPLSADRLNVIENGIEAAAKVADTATTSVAAVKKTADAALPATSAATSAAKWTTARTVSVTGAATGSASIDGSKDVTIDLNLKTVANVEDLAADAGSPAIVTQVNALLASLRTVGFLK